MSAHSTLVIRHSTSADSSALHRLATLDSRELSEGTFVVAEVDGELVAATPLDAGAAAISDPFRQTAGVLELLALRARQLASMTAVA